MTPFWENPDCLAGKHDACNGDAWDADNDQPTRCGCYCHDDGPGFILDNDGRII